MSFGIHKVNIGDIRTKQQIPMPYVKKPVTKPLFLVCDYKLDCIDSHNGFEGEKCKICKHNKGKGRKSFFEPI